ncbi:MAG: zinc ABC transporter solute-binding protein [Desulfobacterales bacterium]|nr:zinc ABC transporter substrate-binding protein [Deltaproteobacteria bacterium]NNK93776.1 zinc ABC transporter solute-binding protein [Desulfobacterales bacterium]
MYGLIRLATIFYLFGIIIYPREVRAGDTTVFVSILPQKYFVQQISKGRVSVEVMVQPGASPATYEPKPSQMKQLASSALYFAIGVPFEAAWLDKIAGVNPNMSVIHTDAEIEKIPMSSHHHEEADDHTNQQDHHQHEVMDPHTWLSPRLVKQQVRVIFDKLSQLVPHYAAEFQINYNQLITSIDKLDTELRMLFRDNEGVQFMVFHPSWGYFAREYGLEQIAIEIEGKAPKPAQLQKLIEYAKEHDIRIIFAQPQFSLKNAKLVAREINGEVVRADPLAEDWLQNIKEVADKFRQASRKP